MPGKKPLRLLIGVRLRDPAAESAAAEALLREAEALGAATPSGEPPQEPFRLPLAWNLALQPLEQGSAALTARIKARVKAGTDTLLLMGYSGAPHPLLRAEELEKELAWCRRNPWGAASRGLLGQEARHLLPTAADPLRERLEGAYSRQGIASVGLTLTGPRALQRFARKGSYRFLAGGPEPGGEPTAPKPTLFYHALLLPAAARPPRPSSLVEMLAPGPEPLFLLLGLG